MLILLPYLQQLLEHPHPLRLQFAGIHQLLVVLPPVAHVAFLRDELGGLAVIGFEEVDGILPSGNPEFVLGHDNQFCGESNVGSFRGDCKGRIDDFGGNR